MGQSRLSEQELSVAVRNLGGIDESTVRLQTGVNVLSGRNATNRTSFLRALMGALGSDGVSLKADADAGEVTLQTATDSYSRRLERTDGRVRTSGDPYLADSTLADLFAFLLESNEARLAVSRQEDLRDLIMRPVDVKAINAKIDSAQAEKRRVDDRIDELRGLDADLHELAAELDAVETNIEETEAELDRKRAELDARESQTEQRQDNRAETESAVEQLQSVQSALEKRRFQRDTEQESIETLRAEREEIETELAELPETSTDEPREIETELQDLRQQRSELDSTTSQLQSVIQFNEEMLEGTNPAIAEALRGDSEPTTPTDRLLESESSAVCWTCGSDIDSREIESSLDRLKMLRQQTISQRRELRDEIETLTERKQALEDAGETRRELEGRLRRTESELDTRTERLQSLESDLEALREQASEIESRIEDDQPTDSERIDRRTAITQLEFELSRHETKREEIQEKTEAIDAKRDKRTQLKTQRQQLQQRLTELRTQVDQLEAEAVEAFNSHMDAVLEALGYENLDRIWIERTTETVQEGRRRVEQSVFQLHIVRRADDGRSYEDTIDHLSESEREVTGLIFALAGYLVHEVHDVVPFMLLDSLEAIDADRIAALVEYLSSYAETIVVALLPEDAQALDDEYHRITEI